MNWEAALMYYGEEDVRIIEGITLEALLYEVIKYIDKEGNPINISLDRI